MDYLGGLLALGSISNAVSVFFSLNIFLLQRKCNMLSTKTPVKVKEKKHNP